MVKKEAKSSIPFFLFFITALLFVIFPTGCRPNHSSPTAEKGKLDVSAWDFRRDGPIALDGEWEFYWNRLLEPEDFHPEKPGPSGAYLFLPGPWDEYGRNAEYPAIGHGTLRLQILKGDVDDLALRVGEINTAWRIWINGKPFPREAGVGWSPETEKTQPRTAVVPIAPTPSASIVEILLQASNYHTRHGGVITRLMLGREQDLRTRETIQSLTLAFVVGGLMVMGFYHLVIYGFRRRDAAPLLLGSYCILWAVNTLASNASGWMLTFFVPELRLETLFIIDLVSYSLTIPIFVMFLDTLFTYSSRGWFVRLSQGAAVAFSLFVLFFPIQITSSSIPFFHAFSLLAIVWAVLLLGRAAWRKHQGAAMILGGFVFIAAAGTNDILFDMNMISSFYFAHVGIFIFSLSQSIALAQSFSRAFLESERLSAELREALAEKARYELNPHFLFNSLASIRGAVNRDASVARQMLTKLSTYCRLVLSPGEGKYITLGEELEKIRIFMDMEKTRHGDYLTVKIEISAELLDLLILPMALQPLVENAVKYGSRTSPESLVVSVNGRKEGSRLVVSVANSGVWVAENEHKATSTGTGIRNLKERLRSRYGEDYRIKTDVEEGTVRVELDVPALESKRP